MTVRFISLLLGLLLLLPCGASHQAQGVQGIVNPGSEVETPQEGREVSVYGARPSLERDTKSFHEGHSALRIQAEAPSDTALGQEIRLLPGRSYWLHGWVKTQNLDPHNAPVYGTLQVQRLGGQGVLASGVSHGGSSRSIRASTPLPHILPITSHPTPSPSSAGK